jgi:prepilin-type N-terminal cleavage/methylation domain-containing protein
MSRRGSGFTLVEMLVAMALSLMIILAVTQVFRLIGDNVLAGRALQEMSSHLRAASDQLQRDLSGLTVPARPWPEPGANQGYLEVHEGPFWDMGLGFDDTSPSSPPDPSLPRAAYTESAYGDIDDVLMFTARATDAPFVGQVMAYLPNELPPPAVPLPLDPNAVHLVFNTQARTPLESKVAEIVWFTRFNDYNGNKQPNPGELTLHRRALLVLPNLDLSDPAIQALTAEEFFSAFDISVRMEQDQSGNLRRVPNTLEDLSRRENRVAHNVSAGFPNVLVHRGLLVPRGSVITMGNDVAWGVVGVDDDGDGGNDNSFGEAGAVGSDDLTVAWDESAPLTPLKTAMAESFGSDVMLSNLLGFDVKVYDPTVTIQNAESGSDAVLPGDPGYRSPTVPLAAQLGSGGYVDLNYQRYLRNIPIPPTPPLSTFAGQPSIIGGLPLLVPTIWTFRSRETLPVTYDTWSLSYEHDGINQDGILPADQGSNGLDDDGINGVDDVAERETTPPYPVPLRGIQVRLRILDRDTRQVRQMTVSSDFIPE